MTLVTSWTLDSPNGHHWQPSIDAAGTVTFTEVGASIGAVPVYGDQSGVGIWTPSISNTGIVTLTSGADVGQNRAALIDPNGVTYIASVIGGIDYWLAPTVNLGDLVTFGEFNQESIECLVKSIEPGPDLSAKLTLVDAGRGVHNAATGPIPPFVSHITLPAAQPNLIQPVQVLSIISDESVMLRSTDGSLTPRVVINVTFASGTIKAASYIELQLRLSNGGVNWERSIYPVAAGINTISLTNISEGLIYDLRLRSLGLIGETTDWVTIGDYLVVGKSSPPPNVTGLSLNDQTLTWAYPDIPQDFLGFEVRVQVGSRTSWADALPLHDGTISDTSFQLFPDTGQRTYLVKGFDTSLNESLAPALLFVDWGAILTQNVVEIINLHDLGFPGTIVNGSILGGQVKANSDVLFWKDDSLPFWTVDTNLFWAGTYSAMSYTASFVPLMEWLPGKLLLDLLVTAASYSVEYAQDAGAPYWGDPSAPFWHTDSTLFWSGTAPVFVPWPGQLATFSRQAYLFRVTTSAGIVQGILAQMDIVIDMPDVQETLVNVPLLAVGSRLALTKTYLAILIVVPTIVEDGSGAARIAVVDKDITGPLLRPLTNDNIPVDAHSDVTVQGY